MCIRDRFILPRIYPLYATKGLYWSAHALLECTGIGAVEQWWWRRLEWMAVWRGGYDQSPIGKPCTIVRRRRIKQGTSSALVLQEKKLTGWAFINSHCPFCCRCKLLSHCNNVVYYFSTQEFLDAPVRSLYWAKGRIDVYKRQLLHF